MNSNTQLMEQFNLGLPKWPQMLVSGKDVTVEQAKEIIFLTDGFLHSMCEYAGGNARKFNEAYRRRAFGLVQDIIAADPEWQWAIRDIVHELLQKQFNFISTEYVDNNWASCSFIHGPHGWCSPLGGIHFVDNIGKWPSVQDVWEDWVKIADRFPFLDCVIQLMNGEGGEDGIAPVCQMRVLNGEVSFITLKEYEDIRKNNVYVFEDRSMETAMERIMNDQGDRELGLPMSWYEEFADRIATCLKQLETAIKSSIEEHKKDD